MGFNLFGSSSKTQQQVLNTTTNKAVGDVDSGAVVVDAGGSVNIVQTDHNAFDNASRLAQGALDVGAGIASDALQLSYETSQMSASLSRNVIDFAGDSIFGAQSLALQVSRDAQDFASQLAVASSAQVRDVASGALTENANLASKALGYVDSAFRDSLSYLGDFVSNLQERAQGQLGDTVKALNEIAVESNKSSDQRLAEVTQNTTKYVVIAVVALGAVFAFGFARRAR